MAAGGEQAYPSTRVLQDYVRNDRRAVKQQPEVAKRDPELLADALDAGDHAFGRVLCRREHLRVRQLPRLLVEDQHLREGPPTSTATL